MKKYQVFISYRREGGSELAGRLSDRLSALGYEVFFDIESMRSGTFNTQILDAISRCDDVLLILPPNALDRCVNEDDWVRQEVAFAIKKHKNIIPIMMRDFEFPDILPADIDKVRYMQGITASSEYFDAVIERIQTLMKSRLKKSDKKTDDNDKQSPSIKQTLFLKVTSEIRKVFGDLHKKYLAKHKKYKIYWIITALVVVCGAIAWCGVSNNAAGEKEINKMIESGVYSLAYEEICARTSSKSTDKLIKKYIEACIDDFDYQRAVQIIPEFSQEMFDSPDYLDDLFNQFYEKNKLNIFEPVFPIIYSRSDEIKRIVDYYNIQLQNMNDNTDSLNKNEDSSESALNIGLIKDIKEAIDSLGNNEESESETSEALVSISSIEVLEIPTKNDYIVGDTIDLDGIILLVEKNDGSLEKVYNGFSYTPTKIYAVGENKIYVSYGDKSTSFSIYVQE